VGTDLKQYKAYIQGSFTSSSNGTFLDVKYPATQEIIAQVPACTKEDTERAILSAKEAFKSWKSLASYQRAEYVMKWLNLMKEEESLQAIGKAITLEMGKPFAAAKSEVFYGADLGEYQSQWARRMDGEIVESDSSKEKILMYREPLGVIGVIVPWNFPIYVLIRKIVPALIAGNTVVVKPSFKSPTSALELAECINRAGMPEGVINIVTGHDEVVGETLTSSEHINMVTFTGSTKVGQHIMEKCARNMTRISLELGGKAPAIVLEDADIELAVKAIKGGRLSNSGQVCSNTERVYVHRSVKDEFTKKLLEAFTEVTIGDGLENPEIEMGCLISANDAKRVHNMVQEAVQEGASILCGGEFIEGLGESFYPPTLLDNCNQTMKIVHDEIFGPVLPLVVFDTLEEAIEMANDSQYGLTSNIYTNNYKYVMELTSHLEAGEVYVNRQQGEAYQGYHSGWKQSGIGGDDGKHGFEEFLQIKTVYLNY
jgi:lactaldehyde dehydrogenase / glycolaldehyde dehydrogenase